MYYLNFIILYYILIVDTANELESELSTHCDAVLEEDDILSNRIQSFVEHSNATIMALKEKYEQLRIDNELLNKLHTASRDTSGVAIGERRVETSTATGKHTDAIGMCTLAISSNVSFIV